MTTRGCCYAPDRHAFYAQYPLDVTPTTDDRPFFFHTTKLRNHSFVAPLLRVFGRHVDRPVNPGAWATGGLTALLVLLAISSRLIVLFIVGPLAVTSRAALGAGWLGSLAYFACLGGALHADRSRAAAAFRPAARPPGLLADGDAVLAAVGPAWAAR